MNGRNHVAAATAFAIVPAACAVLAGLPGTPDAAATAGMLVRKAAGWLAYPGSAPYVRIPCMAACAVLYYAGSLLPDVDRKGSTASKALRATFPGPHRGITHSVWLLLVLAVAGIRLWRPFLALMAGVLAHDLADWPSQAGWAFFYPFGRWKVLNNTVLAKRHWFVLYSSSAPGAESVVAGLVMGASVAAAAALTYLSLRA